LKNKLQLFSQNAFFPTEQFALSEAIHGFFLKRFIAQKIQRDTQGYKIVPLTNLP
jgi:hypothetical protein